MVHDKSHKPHVPGSADAAIWEHASGLAIWLRMHVEGFTQLSDLKRFHGGQSNPTYLLTSGKQRFVLRSKPPGLLLHSAHAIDREYKVLGALRPSGFPVPAPLAFCDDEGIIGRSFYVMSYVDGLTFEDPALPDLDAPQRSRVYLGLIETLAQLHGLNVGMLGLSDFGRGADYLARQVRRWTDQFRNSSEGPVAAMERLSRCLEASVPASSGTVLIHGDYKLNNVLFNHDLEPAAVVDWELATLGDPLADFTALLLNWCLPPDEQTMMGGLSAAIPGIPDIDEIVEQYCSLTARRSIPALDWYLAYNLFRLSCICQGIAGRIASGNAASPTAAVIAARVPVFLEVATDYADRAGILRFKNPVG